MTENTTVAQGEIITQKKVAPGHFEMGLRLPLSFADPVPGQFVMIRSAAHREPLLARPLSVYGFRRLKDHCVLDLLYRLAGAGTSIFSHLQPGALLEILGPLGTGFTLPKEAKAVICIAGGVGIAPLSYLLTKGIGGGEVGKGAAPIFYLGAKTADLLLGLERLAGICDLRICTDDGSRGTKGLVTDCFSHEIDAFDPQVTALFACGPGPMVRSLGLLLDKRTFACQVSLEERMACGLGACLGCAVAVRKDDHTMAYQRVCKDGPVFPLNKIFKAR